MECGTEDNLQFDHIDQKTKLFNITRGVERTGFWEEVAKCQLLCVPHHTEKSRKEGSSRGESHGATKLRALDVKYIRCLSELGHSQRAIAREFGVSKYAVHSILVGKTWKHV